MAYTYRSSYRLGRDRQAIAVQLTTHVEGTSTFKPRWVLWRLLLGFQPRTFFLGGHTSPSSSCPSSQRDGRMQSELQTLLFLGLHGVEADYVAPHPAPLSACWKRHHPCPRTRPARCWRSEKAQCRDGDIPCCYPSRIEASQTSPPCAPSIRCSRQPSRSWISSSLGECPPHSQHKGEPSVY